MRVLKFRAWDKTNKKMLDRVLAGPGDPCSSVWDDDDKEWKCFDDACGEIMQFTGQFDKEGKEGYTDDLVEMYTRSLWRIVWDEYYCRYHLELVKGDEIRKKFDMGQLQFARIVGNVHENPELMKDYKA